MAARRQTQTRTGTSTATLVATALLAGAGLAAAAGLATTSMAKDPALLVRLTPGQPLVTNTVSGSDDVALLSFDLLARGAEATVDQMVFAVFGDSDADFAALDRDADPSDRFLECWMESSSGTIVGSPQPVVSGYLTFSDVFTVPASVTSTYVVRCDLSNASLVDGDADRFAAWIGGEPGLEASIGGTALSGSSLAIGQTAYDTLNSLGEISTRVNEQGTLAIALSRSTPSSDILHAASTGNHVGQWDFRARGEDFNVDTLTFDITGEDSAVTSVSLVCGSGADLMTHTFYAYPSGGRVVFDAADCDVLSTEDHVTIDLYADLNAIGSGAESGDTVQFSLNATDAGTFEAVGSTSGQTVTESELASTVAARQFTIRKSEPTFGLSSWTPSNPGTAGLAELFRFNLSAASTGDVAVNQILFRVSSTDNAGTGWNDCGDGASTKRFGANGLWNLYDLDDLSSPISDEGDWSFLKADGSACGQAAEPVAYAVLNLGADAATGAIEIPAGDTSTIGLYVDTSGASAADDDSVRIDLLSEREARAIRHRAVLWDDLDAGVSNVTGYLLQILPLTGTTVTY